MIAMPPASPVTTRQPQAAATPTPPPAPVVHEVVAPVIVQTVTVEQAPSRTDLLVGTERWTWVELRDYVVAQIIERFGAFPRDSRKEYGIFNRFLSQYGQDGIAVAKFAFGPACDGWWANAPISINRFSKGSDPYFVAPILARLADTAEMTPA